MRLLWIAPAYAPYKDEDFLSTSDYLRSAWNAMAERAEQTAILPPGSSSRLMAHSIVVSQGELQTDIASPDYQKQEDTPCNSALHHMLNMALSMAGHYDYIINLGHDSVPHLWMERFNGKLVSIPSASYNNGQWPAGLVIQKIAREFPENFCWSSYYQRASFSAQGGAVIYQPFLKIPSTIGVNQGYLLFAGRIVRDKGLHFAARIAALTKMPLVVAGTVYEPDYLEECQAIYPDMEVLGPVHREHLFDLMANASVFLQVQSTRSGVFEAFGRVTAEALMSGCPVLCFDSGANSELVTHEVGCVVREGDLDSACDAIERLRRFTRQDRAAIACFSKGRFSPSRFAREFESFLHALDD